MANSSFNIFLGNNFKNVPPKDSFDQTSVEKKISNIVKLVFNGNGEEILKNSKVT